MKTFWASAIADTACDGDAFSALWTFSTVRAAGKYAVTVNYLVGRLALAFQTVAFFAKHKWVSAESCWTLAIIASRHVFTNGVYSTSWLFSKLCAFVNVPTASSLRISCIASRTDANAVANVLVFDALLSGWTRFIGTASRGQSFHQASTLVWIPGRAS